MEGRVDDYVLIDCPGQAEVFTHHHSLWEILHRLEKKLGYRVRPSPSPSPSPPLLPYLHVHPSLLTPSCQLVALHLVDSQVLTRPSLYISTLLLGIRTQLHLGLPHLNVFTKLDLLSNYEPLPLPLHFYTEASPLSPILPYLSSDFAVPTLTSTTKLRSSNPQDPEDAIYPPQQPKTPKLSAKFQRLNEAIVDLVEDFPMGYETLAIEDKKSMAWLLRQIDRAGGYAYGGAEGAGEGVWETVAGERGEVMDVRDVEERWITHRGVYDEWEERLKAAEEERRRTSGGGDEGLSVKENWDDGDGGGGMDEDELADMIAMRERNNGVKVVRVPKGD